MNGVELALSVVGWLLASLLGYATVADAGRRAWARSAGRARARWLGVLAAVLVAVAAGTFSVWPPGGVYVLAVAGVLAYAAGVVAAAGAAGLADAAVGDGATTARWLRAFWCASAVHYRATRTAFALALLAFGLAAVVAGIAVDPVVRTVGALAVGCAGASLTALGAVGVFVPGGYDESVAAAVRSAV